MTHYKLSILASIPILVAACLFIESPKLELGIAFYCLGYDLFMNRNNPPKKL